MIIADTHVHFYPCYDAGLALRGLISRLHLLDPASEKAAFLTERQECCFFTDLRDGRIDLPDGLTVEATPEDDALRVVDGGKHELYLFAGRQIATKERLEVLTLASDTMIEDGLPTRDVISQALKNGSVPVLAWALGKWLGKRNGIVGELIRSYGNNELLVGDSSMRPTFFPQPALINEAISKGTSIIAGSDPLPFKGDEQYMGTYATLIDGAIEESAPVTSVKNILRTSTNTSFRRTGNRCGIVSVIGRQIKL